MRTLLFLLIFLYCSLGLVASETGMGDSVKRISYEEYIVIYSPIAVKHMKEYGIPASITLAQGLLESGAGNSELAVKANNHFGIKCHKGWEGDTFLKDDDAKNDCFRKYKTPEESFADHAQFLTTRSRYAALFELSITDYKGWANGLKAAGYATNPAYAERLIQLIERYELNNYDTGKANIAPAAKKADRKRSTSKVKITVSKTPVPAAPAKSYTIVQNNGVKMVIARPGETLKSIADSLQIRPWMLRKYNELSENQEITAGDFIYIQSKKKKGAEETHIVKQGESLHDIAQQHAIRLSSLMKTNKLTGTEIPNPGTVLRLR